MATSTPPPYFPQSSLSPQDPNRYKKFKIAVFLLGMLILTLLGGAIVGIIYLIKYLL